MFKAIKAAAGAVLFAVGLGAAALSQEISYGEADGGRNTSIGAAVVLGELPGELTRVDFAPADKEWRLFKITVAQPVDLTIGVERATSSIEVAVLDPNGNLINSRRNGLQMFLTPGQFFIGTRTERNPSPYVMKINAKAAAL